MEPELSVERLSPIIERIAQCVSRGGPAYLREEFVLESVGEIFLPRPRSESRIKSYDPEWPIEPWLYRVLSRIWNDRLSNTNDKCGNGDLANQSAVVVDEEFEQGRFILCSKLSKVDCERVGRWDIRVRIELFLLTGWYTRLPDDLWQTWIKEAREVYGIAESVVIPSPELDTPKYDNLKDRMPIVASLLGLRTNTLSQRWHRTRRILTELDGVAESYRLMIEARI